MATALDPAEDLRRLSEMDPPAVYAALDTGPGGLSADEARGRLSAYGANELPPTKKVRVGLRLLRQFRNLFNVLLLFATALSFVFGAVFGDASSLQMGWVILGVVLFNSAFSVGQEYRAERTVEALRRMIPANAKVVRGGNLIEIPVAEVVPGDVIDLEQGERVPADARLTSAFALAVDHATLTGESDPRPRSAEAGPPAPGSDVTELPNLVFAGTTVVSGSGTAVVVATGVRTRFGQIVTRTQEVPEEPSPLQREIDRFARSDFTVAIAVALIFLALAVLWRGLSPLAALLFMIGVAIDLVPEGFQLTVTLALAFSSVSMARSSVVAKRLASVETLGSTTVICTDKTGTITTGQMTVRKVWLGGESYTVTGEGFSPEGDVRRADVRLGPADSPVLRTACEVAALNNQASLVPPLDRAGRRWTAVGDTTEAALLAFAIKAGVKPKPLLQENPRIGLVPFDSTRKMMTSIHRTPEGVVAYTKGAGREVLERCVARLTAKGTEPLTAASRAEILAHVDDLSREAYRVLALAFRPLPRDPGEKGAPAVERDLVFVGLVAIQDPPRPETPNAVRVARDAGLRVFMLTGDHELTAEAIARQVGLLSAESQPVIPGAGAWVFEPRGVPQVGPTTRGQFSRSRLNHDDSVRVPRITGTTRPATLTAFGRPFSPATDTSMRLGW